MYEVISKADPDYDPMRTPRGGFAENRGRFSRTWGPGTNVAGPYGTNGAREMTINFTRPLNKKPISNPKDAGLPEGLKPGGKGKLKPEQAAYLQASYMQLKNQLGEFDRAGLGGDVKVQLHGRSGTNVIAGTDIDEAFVSMASGGKMPTSATISVPYSTVGGAYFDALSSIPGSRADLNLNAMGAVRGLPSNISPQSEFSQGWFDSSYALSDNEPRFRRLKSGAELVDTFVPASAMKTKMALTGAKYVGELGPDAEKIIGPSARKLTYRSRGTERKNIDPVLSNIDASDRQRAIIGYTQPVVRRGELRASGSPGTLVSYFQDKLPNKNYWELQRKSGAIPPSEGVVIDSSGKIVSQSVGFKDDHYLPFNIKALSKLRGGEYVRTRSTGGPTTEDIYTALVGGATGFTVVSRSGVFTVEFDETFSGRRRYNDKAGKMVERYGKLLDAAGSGEVTLNSIDTNRYQEIVEQARSEAPTDPKAFEARKNQLLEREKVMPTPAKGDELEIKREIRADLKDEIANGGTPFAQEYAEARQNAAKSNAANRKLAQQYGFDYTEPDANVLEGQLAQMVEDEVGRRYPKAEKAAMDARSYKAMRLDGEGYHAALQSLKEQYPYYIANVRFIPGGPERDKGYVKPRYLRPDDVWEGYFDPAIKGKAPETGITAQMARHTEHGKVKASATNYQNYRNKAQADVDRDDVKVAPTATPTADGIKTATGSLSRVPVNAADLAILEAYRASRKIKNADGVPFLPADKDIKAQLPAWANPTFELGNLQGTMAPVLRDPGKREELIRDLEAIFSTVEADDSYVQSPEFEPFMSAMKKVKRGKEAPALGSSNDALDQPTRLFSFPKINAINDTAGFNDAFESLKPTWEKIQGIDGRDEDAKITNYIIIQQNKADDAMKQMSSGDPEPPQVVESQKEAVKAHMLRALIAKGEEFKAAKRPVNTFWVTGGPSASDSVVHTRAITP
jgi:hypothetical protein